MVVQGKKIIIANDGLQLYRMNFQARCSRSVQSIACGAVPLENVSTKVYLPLKLLHLNLNSILSVISPSCSRYTIATHIC